MKNMRTRHSYIKAAFLTKTEYKKGQASMEYVVVCAALAFALFYPIKDANSPDEPRTTVEILLDGLKTAYKKFSYAISLPT